VVADYTPLVQSKGGANADEKTLGSSGVASREPVHDPKFRPLTKESTLSRTLRVTPPASPAEPELLARILKSLDDDKADDIVTIDLVGRSSLADALVIASGTSTRHVASMAEHLARRLKEAGYGAARIEGLSQGDWVVLDAGDVIVHVFRPEVRTYYDLEGIWSVDERAPRTPALAR
jgi:ribosome-associated protein